MRRLMAMLCATAVLAGACLPAARAGLFDDLKAKAAEEAKKKAIEIAKQKLAEKTGVKLDEEAPAEPEDKIMGEYAGTFTPTGGRSVEAVAKVVGYGQADKVTSWDVVVTAKDYNAKTILDVALKAAPDGDAKATITGDFTGRIADGSLTAKGDKGALDLKPSRRKSPTLGAKPPGGAVVLLPFEEGKPTNLEEWTNPNWLLLPDGSAMVQKGSSQTTRSFRDYKLHVEFRCPYEPHKKGQGRGNSGVYIHSKFEVQVLDSFGLTPKMGDCGAIYGVRIPSLNASLPPMQWQTYDITFRAPRLGTDGKVKVYPKFIEVLHNGIKIHENVDVTGVTRAGKAGAIGETGPIMLQHHGNPVRYRNIWLVETK